MNNKKQVSRKFFNFSKFDFTWKYDGVEYDFPKQDGTTLLDYMAELFAKHLIDREINRLSDNETDKEKKKKFITNNQTLRKEMYAKCFPSKKDIVYEDVNKATTDILNEPKATEKKSKSVKKEEEFEGLNDK